jgi:hypothetical protein
MVAAASTAGIALSDIFREIDEELRRDNLEQLWKKYGKYIIVLGVVIVVATAAVMGWRAYQQRQAENAGTQYAAALDLARQGKDADAAAAFGVLAQNSTGGHRLLARFEEAAAKLRTGDTAGAQAIYDQLAADSATPPEFRDVATVLAARYALDKGDPQLVVAKLQPLAASTSPWHGVAQEMIALAELKAGDKTKARADFEALSKDATLPSTLRERAGIMAQSLSP